VRAAPDAVAPRVGGDVHDGTGPLVAYRVLLGGRNDSARIEAAMLSGAISAAVMHPLVADIDDQTLRTKLIAISRRVLDLPVE
jgi:hypothetical protein